MRLTSRQREVLLVLAEFDCECWGEAWTHCDGWPGGVLAFNNFNRVADSLVRKGLVTEGDRLEITELGKSAAGICAQYKGSGRYPGRTKVCDACSGEGSLHVT